MSSRLGSQAIASAPTGAPETVRHALAEIKGAISDLHYGAAMDNNTWIQPLPPTALHGSERFVGTEATVQDFWRFALGDLRMNNARGYLAEFLVAQALGLGEVSRVEWDEYDLLLDSRIRIEVKSSAYLQAWEQRALSRISFSGLRGTRYHPRHGDDPGGRQLNAHVYVFCVQASQEHASYDPLDVGQWQFYVVPKSELESAGMSIGLASVHAAAGGPTGWDDLREAVLIAAEGQSVNVAPWWQ